MGWQWKLVTEACTGCGICFDVCPEAAIRMTREMAYPRSVEGRCIGCLECVQECPFDAIEVNESIYEEEL